MFGFDSTKRNAQVAANAALTEAVDAAAGTIASIAVGSSLWSDLVAAGVGATVTCRGVDVTENAALGATEINIVLAE